MKTQILRFFIYLLPFFFLSPLFALDCKPLVITPDVLNYGTVIRESTKQLQLNVRNDAFRFNLSVDDFRFIFSRTAGFFGDVKVEYPAGSVDSQGDVRISDNGGTIVVKVTLKATGPAQVISGAEIRVEEGGGQLTNPKFLCSVPITGTITEPLDAPPVLIFGNVLVHSTKTLVAKVTALSSLHITAINVQPPYSISQFSGKEAPPIFPISLKAGASKDLFVTVAPTTSGSISGPLTIVMSYDQVSGATKSINLQTTAAFPQSPDLIPTLTGLTQPEVVPGGTQSNVTFQLKVNNSGSTSGACEGTVFLDDVAVKTINIISINPGQTIELPVNFLTNKTGSHQLKVKVDTNNINPELNENNNTAGPVTVNFPAPPPPADLIPQILGTPVITSVGAGQSQVSVELKTNNPGGPSVACNAVVTFSGNVVHTFPLNAIGAGGSLQQNVTFQTTKTGSFNLKVKLDSNSLNAESNESNNVTPGIAINIP